jgi:hypothetical protein
MPVLFLTGCTGVPPNVKVNSSGIQFSSGMDQEQIDDEAHAGLMRNIH